MPSLPANVAELVKKATAHDPRDRFASARDLGVGARARLLQIGAASKEREVTAALSTLLEAEADLTTRGERRGDPAGRRRGEPGGLRRHGAVSEVEMIETSGPIRQTRRAELVPDAQTERISLPLPPEAFRPRPAVAASASGAEPRRT